MKHADFESFFIHKKTPLFLLPTGNQIIDKSQLIQNDEMIVYRSKNKTLKLKIKISRISRDRGG